MDPDDRNPQTQVQADLDVAADRRRPGRRADAPVELVPLLRGEFDDPLPADTEAVPPPIAFTRERLVGGVVALTLIVIGVVLRFVA